MEGQVRRRALALHLDHALSAVSFVSHWRDLGLLMSSSTTGGDASMVQVSQGHDHGDLPVALKPFLTLDPESSSLEASPGGVGRCRVKMGKLQ